MSKSKIFIGIAISFAFGILIASAFNVPRQAVYIGLGIFSAGFALSILNESKKASLAELFLFCMGLGCLRLQISIVPNEYAGLFDSKQQLEGYIVEDADVRPTQQLITFRPDGYSQNILLNTVLTQQFFYGDRLVVEGKITETKNFSEFDYQKYLERYNVYATVSYPKILILKSHQLNAVKELLLKIKAAFIQRTNELLKEPQSSLSVGLIIGGHSNLPKDLVNNFSITGISHIIAVSGFNITIIVSALTALAYVLGRRASFWLTLLTITAFVIIAGASASVLRAAIMGYLLLIAVSLGRQYAITPAIFFAALVMLIINPKILYWDVGFQLSFAATLGIICFYPVFEKLFAKLPQAGGIKTLVQTTLSAIVATLPFILFNFGVLSFSAIFVNILVLPVVPFAMLFGFLAILPFVGPGFALLANWLLVYILKIIAIFAGLPYSSLNIQISAWIFWFLILGVFALYFLLKYISKSKLAPVEQNVLV